MQLAFLFSRSVFLPFHELFKQTVFALQSLLKFRPDERLTTTDALNHEYFAANAANATEGPDNTEISLEAME